MKKINLGLAIVAAVMVAGAVYASSVSSYVVPQLVDEINTVITSVEGRITAVEAAGVGGALDSAKIIVGNSGGTGEAQTVTGDISLSNAGVVAITADSIVNADIKSNAAIVYSKLAQGSALSVLGVTGNAEAANASIAAGTDHHVLRRSGTAVGFGLLVDANVDAAAAIAKTKISGNALVDADFNSLRAYLADGLLIHGTLTISATTEKFKTTTTAVYTIAGVTYTKAATDDLVFSAANTINTAAAAIGVAYGIWLVQIDAAGTVSTKPGGGLADQVYASSALAIAALPAVDAGNASLGYILVASPDQTAFTANTTALTTIGSFSNTQIKALPAAK